MSDCANHAGIRAEALCLNCQRLYCASCLNSAGQCGPCGAKFPKAVSKRATAAENEAMRLGRGLRRPAPRTRALGITRFVVGGLIVAAIGSVAYFQFDLIKRSLPQGKRGAGVAGKTNDGEGRNLQGLMNRVESSQTTPEDEKKLDSLMTDIEQGRENFSAIDSSGTGRQSRPEPAEEDPGSFDEADDGFSVGEPAPSAPVPEPPSAGAGRQWLHEAGVWLGKARDGMLGLLSPAASDSK